MKISRLTTAVIEANFDWTFVKIETDDGVTGYGEAFFGPGLTSVIKQYASLLIGEDPTSIDRLLRRLQVTSTYMLPGLAMHAIGGIETALLDVIGKNYRMPVWQLLGGKYRDAVTIYADCHGGEALEGITPLLVPRTPQWARTEAAPAQQSVVSLKHHGSDASNLRVSAPAAYAGAAERMTARGFRILKFDADVQTPYETDEYNRHLSSAEIEFAATRVRAVREAVGPEIEIAVDCHWNYDVQSAIRLAAALEDVNLIWLEDPVPPENIRSVGQVQRATRTPVATGENNHFRIDFERLILDAGLRILTPDVQKLGIWEGRKLADLADIHHVNVAWHNISSPVGTMAGVHLAAATPNFLALEWHAATVPFFDELVGSEGPLIEN
ncbi:MAG: mandelate racemase/muconate lactonizing enzyme family protein, partial [Acidobacteriaceae bacterium]|nr:mandelate racemase/muconate lactonizing enzyme family protein [Acidobacteriaceae bacterium]